jgi:hypothetical protein
MNTWTLIEKRADYYFWKFDCEKPYYNVTTTPEPPTTEAGYYSYAFLLHIKGVKNFHAFSGIETLLGG